MHENSFENLKTHDVGGHASLTRDRITFERLLHNGKSLEFFQRVFIKALREIIIARQVEDVNLWTGQTKKPKARVDMFYLGDLLKRKVNHEGRISGRRRFDKKGLARAGAFLQNVLFKIRRAGLDLAELYDKEFLRGFCGEDNLLEIDSRERFEEMIKGAETMHDYFLKIKDEPDVLFIGTDENLDAGSSIDFVVARTNDPEAKHPQIDRVDIVEVKSSPPNHYDVSQIHDTHRAHAKGHRIGLISGAKTGESHSAYKYIKEHEPEKLKEFLFERFIFLKDLARALEKGIEISEWADVVRLAELLAVDPIILSIRINNMPDFLQNLLNTQEFNLIKELRLQIRAITIPVEVLGKFRRLYAPPNGVPNTFDTLSWRSVVAYRFHNDWRQDVELFEEL